jgi:VanZ like family
VRTVSRAWFAAAIVVSALLVLGAPLVGQLTSWLRDVARGHYRDVLAAVVVSAAALSLGTALLVIKDRRAFRYSCLAAATAMAAGYAWAARTGVPDVDAAERFHFIEYGLVAVLFYKTWLPAHDGSVLLKPVVAGFIVGTLEEWLQWVVPGRVGEMHDVLLNLVAVWCGVLFALALDPPPRIPFALRPESRSSLARFAVAAVVVFTGFFQSVHLGHEVVDREAGVFRSHYTSGQLAAASLDRSHSWRANPPTTLRPLSWENQYLSEGIAHVRRRNQRWDEGNLPAAWQEHRILEKYFAPVLKTPSYLSAAAPAWHDAQRSEAAATVGSETIVYESDALPYAVFTWPRWAFWSVVGTAVLVFLRVLR